MENTPSALPEHTAPSASLDHSKAQAAPAHPGAPPPPRGGSPRPPYPASRRSKVEDFSTARCDERDSEAARRAGVGYIHWGHLCHFETERLVAPDAARTAGLAPESSPGGGR